MNVDHVDLRILQALLQDGRMSVAALAEAVSVSRANAYARIAKLREAGIITGFSVVLDRRRLGLDLAAVVLVDLESRRDLEEVVGSLRAMPEVESAAILAGQYDAVLTVRFPDMEGLRKFVVEGLQAVPSIRSTVTSLILDEVLPTPTAQAADLSRVLPEPA